MENTTRCEQKPYFRSGNNFFLMGVMGTLRIGKGSVMPYDKSIGRKGTRQGAKKRLSQLLTVYRTKHFE